MPFETLSATPTAGNDEVLATLRYLSRSPLKGNGASVRDIALALQYTGHYGPHADALTALEAEVTTVLGNLVTATLVKTTTHSGGHGEWASTGYTLTATGVTAARRAHPFALWP